ncbi:GIY-YIG catalytic domain-containing endonuclease [Acanthocystis turfacea Chlorella virus OR0704.3]|nr:GIY-YIG catalytic domain-containing endonuclease [Acanthocystis turfacea Chlorella virus OR0704.3]
MGFIYRLTSPSGKSYVGQTTRPIEERLKEHQFPSSHCVAISNAIQHHGWENMKKEWHEIPDEDLNFYEEMLVAFLGTLSPCGYNLREGGGSGGKMSEEVKQKIREVNIGKTLSDTHKQKIRGANLGKTLSDDHKQKISEAQFGKKNHMYGQNHTDKTKQKISDSTRGDKNHMFGQVRTDEVKQKIAAARTGKGHTDEAKKKISAALIGEKNHNSKMVYQYDLNGAFVQSFSSTGEAARSLNKSSGSNIRSCARGECKSAHGFKWSYTEL